MFQSLKNKFVRAAFAKDEDASILVFVLVVFSIIMMVGGSAIDLARHENSRATLQYNLDRAVLAAASLKQQRDPQDVVEDYMSRIEVTEDFDLTVSSYTSGFERIVTATAVANVDMWFLSMAGVDNMDASARSVAIEKRQNIEISLVLDVSGSMGNNSRLVNLKVAAKDFVDTILADAEEDTVAISIVPFNSNVAPSQTVFDALKVDKIHDYTTCLDFSDADFGTSAIDPASMQDQAAYAALYGSFGNLSFSTSSCNDKEYFQVLPYSNSTTDLHAKIDSLNSGGYTAGHVGIKWGLALLDPKFNSVTASLIHENEVDDGLSAMPAAYDDEQTRKIIVMMSDGANTYEFRLGDHYKSGPSQLMAVHLSTPDASGVDRLYYIERADGEKYYSLADEKWITDDKFNDLPSTLDNYASTERLDWEDAWAILPIDRFRTITGDNSPRNDFLSWTGRSGSEANGLMDTACTTAADNGVVVYTIGFEMNESAKDALRDCASSVSHFYDAQGTEISDVFQAIAASILRLKLTS